LRTISAEVCSACTTPAARSTGRSGNAASTQPRASAAGSAAGSSASRPAAYTFASIHSSSRTNGPPQPPPRTQVSTPAKFTRSAASASPDTVEADPEPRSADSGMPVPHNPA